MTDYRFKPKQDRQGFGWHDRGYIPHFDGGQFSQFVTFRLYDSMPKKVLEGWVASGDADSSVRKKIEEYLDAGYGACWLNDERVAECVSRTLKFHAGANYRLHSWVIMPNHIHALLTPAECVHLPDILHSIKSFSAQQANKILGRTGQFWQHETFDRYIRDQEHFVAVVRYIENNPVKAGLSRIPEEWRFGSAYENHLAANE